MLMKFVSRAFTLVSTLIGFKSTGYPLTHFLSSFGKNFRINKKKELKRNKLMKNESFR